MKSLAKKSAKYITLYFWTAYYSKYGLVADRADVLTILMSLIPYFKNMKGFFDLEKDCC